MCPYLVSSFISQDLSQSSELVSACLDLPVCLSTFVCLEPVKCDLFSLFMWFIDGNIEHVGYQALDWLCPTSRPSSPPHPPARPLFSPASPKFIVLIFWAQICVSIVFLSVFLSYQPYMFFVILYRDISPYISIDLFHVRCNSVEAFFAQSYLYPKSSPAWIFLLCLPLSHLSLSTCQCPNLDLTIWSPHMLVAFGFGRAHGVKMREEYCIWFGSIVHCGCMSFGPAAYCPASFAKQSSASFSLCPSQHDPTLSTCPQQPMPIRVSSTCRAAGYEVFS